MDVLVTGAYGRCGTAILDHLGDDHAFTCFDRREPPAGIDLPAGTETVVGDVSDGDALRSAAAGADAMVHLAAHPRTDGSWADVLEPNVVGTYNALEAARDAGLETVVFASTNHVMGMYEREHAPALYRRGYDLVLDHSEPVRPDSLYGVSKAFGEALGRYYVEAEDDPRRFYAIRICSVREEAHDHPYADAERGVADGDWERGDEAYRRAVARLKATWHSRRDFAALVACCLADRSVEFGAFSGVSDNRRRWFSIERARAVLGYDPQDDAETWDAPPE